MFRERLRPELKNKRLLRLKEKLAEMELTTSGWKSTATAQNAQTADLCQRFVVDDTGARQAYDEDGADVSPTCW